MLTHEEQRYLLTLARHALTEEICRSAGEMMEPMETPALNETRGAFVTLYRHGELRGCLGLLMSDRPLADTVALMARRAGTEDPRFDPVTAKELPGLSIEISVLSPFHPITSPQEITIGEDGLLIQRGLKRGLLLPQVGVKYHFTPEEFLEETCLKAGLPRHAWKESGTTLQAFTAEVISEGER